MESPRAGSGPKEFVPPPEAPIYEPTKEEFADPLTFIAKIRPEVEKHGICKIRPPADWQPPFAVDIDNFRFVPRMQKINELEATTRVKIIFLEKLLKFWDLQGLAIKIPMVDDKLLDLHLLHKTVQNEGGYDLCCKDKKWSRVASKMKMRDPSYSNILKQHYEKFLYPFDLFEAGVTHSQESQSGGEEAGSVKSEQTTDNEERTTVGGANSVEGGANAVEGVANAVEGVASNLEGGASKSVGGASSAVDGGSNVGGVSTEAQSNVSSTGNNSSSESTATTPSRGRKRKDNSDKTTKITKSPKKEKGNGDAEIDYTANNELKKLQFFGAGPKAAVPVQVSKVASNKPEPASPVVKEEPVAEPETQTTDDNKRKMRERTTISKPNYSETNTCVQCDQCTNEFSMLTCDSCKDTYHTYCLIPPLSEVPKSDWRCPKCIAKECNKPKAAYGFEQAKRDFTLQEFGEMADQFKVDYFQMPVHKVPYDTVEKEFWRLTTNLEEDVTVNYGADIHALVMGSGFPTETTKNLKPEDEEYKESGWNLNNLPVHDRSVLKFVTGDVSGMKVPWCYVGMCFSSFCWHIEDHWSYSINYLHWGEPKTWYGVRSSDAEALERVMKSRAGELFEQSPDLLHHITTILNPNELMEHGIKVVRTDQCAGEFIITCPRAYHAGFNQGYNFAEAVNFCPADWMPFGRGCIQNYKSVKRFCVFSHEELVCKMASDPDSLNVEMSSITHQELLAILESEKNFRQNILKQGINQSKREVFELMADDERQCSYCKTTCFMSAITCSCRKDNIVCIEHGDELCKCDNANKTLRYRYTLAEIANMILGLNKKSESFQIWADKVNKILDSSNQQEKCDMDELKSLITDFKLNHYSAVTLLKSLQKTVSNVEKCSKLADRLINHRIQPSSKAGVHCPDMRSRLTLNDIKQFYKQITLLPCTIPQQQPLKEFIESVEDVITETNSLLNELSPPVDKLNKLYNYVCSLDLIMTEQSKLNNVINQTNWLQKVKDKLAAESSPPLSAVKSLIESGQTLGSQPLVDKQIERLCSLVLDGERWEEKAVAFLNCRPRQSIINIELMLNECRNINLQLPTINRLRTALNEAKQWVGDYDQVQSKDQYSYLEELEELASRGRAIPIKLDSLAQIESQMTAARSWRERTYRSFQKKQSTHTLLEMLSPRQDIGLYQNNRKKNKSKNNDDNSTLPHDRRFTDQMEMMSAFKRAQNEESELMNDLRTCNREKDIYNNTDLKFCSCRKGVSGTMFLCELCREWFHASCVPMMNKQSTSLIRPKSGHSAWMTSGKDKFLCPLCQRSRRPKLETILSLLVSLQKLPVRISEGEALQILTERAMEWQERVKLKLATDELSAALNKITSINQKINEQTAREKTEKIISTQLHKAQMSSGTAPKPHSGLGMPLSSGLGMPPSSGLGMPPSGLGKIPTIVPKQEPADVPNISADKTCADMSEHAYSSASKSLTKIGTHLPYSSADSTSGDSPRKHVRKSPLIPRTLPESNPLPQLELNIKLRVELEELLMEGDLMEATLEEGATLWKLLQACYQREGTATRVVQFGPDPAVEPISKTLIRIKKEKKKVKLVKRRHLGESDSVTKTEHTEVKSPVTPAQIRKRKSTDTTTKSAQKSTKQAKPTVTLTSTPPLTTLDKKPPLKRKVKKRKKIKLAAAAADLKRVAEKTERSMCMDTSTGQLEEEEDCSADHCHKPTGDEVDWVQCDKCELWFHLVCLGIAKTEVKENEDFICFKCAGGDNCNKSDISLNISEPNSDSKPSVTTVVTKSAEEEVISVVGTPVPSASQSPVDNLSQK